MRSTTADGVSIMYDQPITDLLASGNQEVLAQLQSLAASGPSSDYYAVLTFEVPLSQ